MKTAFILAAGRGERLRPLTDTCPKALCSVRGTPLIAHHIQRLASSGFERVIINHAHLGGQIRRHLGRGQAFGIELCYTPEPPGGLETGGGIANALPLFGSEPLLILNADIDTDYPFDKLVIPETYLAHLVLVPTPIHRQTGDFHLNHGQVFNTPKTYVFSGIAAYHPELFKSLPPGRYSLTPFLRTIVQANQVSGELFNGHWLDIGSPEQLALANMLGSKNPL